MKNIRYSTQILLLSITWLLGIMLFQRLAFAYDKPLIIDHTYTRVTALSQADIENAKAKLHIAYGHSSHGSQLVYGMAGSASTESDGDSKLGGLIRFANQGGLGLTLPHNMFTVNCGGTGGALDMAAKTWAWGTDPFPGVSDLGDPSITAWATATRTHLNSHPLTNVIMWSWCGQADTSAANIDIYLNLMEGLIADYPNVKFVFMTGHLNGSGLTGNLHLRNDQIRNYCRLHNKILYDFEDIESYDPDGVYYGDKIPNDNCDYDSNGDGSRDRNWAIDWQNSHTQGVDWYTCNAAHSQSLNGNQKAYAAWALWVKLAQIGENNLPVASDISTKVIKDTQNSTLNSLKLQASDADAGDILTFTVLSPPAHGQLKEETSGQEIITVPYSLSSNKLRYIPAPGFTGQDSFAYKANDGTSDSNTATVSLSVVEWFAPIGIPEPPFGIKETYRMYDDPAKRNPGLTYTRNAEGGYYTHYVDNTHPAATDTGNAYGTASRPRLTVPTDLPEGSVVEVRGGPYNRETGSGGYGWVWFSGTGTVTRPIFIRGTASEIPVYIKAEIRIGGSYIIIENLELNDSRFKFHDDYAPGVREHIAIRNTEIYGYTYNSGALIGLGGTGLRHDNVLYNNHIHHNGNVAVGSDLDVIGIMGGDNIERIWIVDNHIHHNDGDSIQLNAAGGAWAQNGEWPKYVYIGRNTMHDDRENAIDLKDCEHVIISQNDVFNYTGDDRIFGVIPTPRVIHSGMPTPIIAANEGSRVVWTIFNDIYNSGSGLRVSDGYVRSLNYMAGNKLHDLERNAIQTWRDTDLYVVNNVIYNVGVGFWGAESGNSDAASYTIVNNIFSKINGYEVDGVATSPFYVRIERDSPAGRCVLTDNIFYQGRGFTWGDNLDEIYDSFAEFIANEPGKGQDCMETDPLFIDAANGDGDFHLQPISPAIDSGIESNVYQTFYDLYGIDIRKDMEGIARPQGSAWDIGAYEYASQGAVLYGDVSGDADISAYDAALAAQAAVGLITLTAEQTQNADVSGDAEVSAYDAALIAQYSVGIIDHFPVQK